MLKKPESDARASFQATMLSDNDLIALVRSKCFDFNACAKEAENHSSLSSDDIRLTYTATMKRMRRTQLILRSGGFCLSSTACRPLQGCIMLIDLYPLIGLILLCISIIVR